MGKGDSNLFRGIRNTRSCFMMGKSEIFFDLVGFYAQMQTLPLLVIDILWDVNKLKYCNVYFIRVKLYLKNVHALESLS